jgi:hypothetical protein
MFNICIAIFQQFRKGLQKEWRIFQMLFCRVCVYIIHIIVKFLYFIQYFCSCNKIDVQVIFENLVPTELIRDEVV